MIYYDKITTDLSLKGNVKSIEKFSYRIKDESGSITKIKKEIISPYGGLYLSQKFEIFDIQDYCFKFDEYKRIIDIKKFDNSSNLNSNLVFIYDSNKLLERVTKNNLNQEIERIQYIYNGHKVVEEICYDKNKVINKKLYIYYESGHLKETKLINEKKEIIYNNLYKYDIEGNLTEEINNEKRYTLKLKYDYNGNLIEEIKISHGKMNIQTNKREYEYNTKDQLVVEKMESTFNNDVNQSSLTKNFYNEIGQKIYCEFNLDGKKKYFHFIYDKQNNIIESKQLFSSHLIEQMKLYFYNNENVLIEERDCDQASTTIKRYNNHNNLIENCKIEIGGKEVFNTKYDYEYDKYGNWIKQFIYIKNNPEFLVERNIEYFD